MTDETNTAGELEAGRDAVDTLERVQAAVRRADETLAMLQAVPIAGTQSARHQMTATRAGVLDRLLEEVRPLVGLERPAALGQMGLEETPDA